MRVLVFNFLAGIKDRGIPVYARELEECLRRVGAESVELRCPRWLRHGSPALLNLAFVLFEQIVAPLMRVLRGCALTVYPYNSCGVVDALAGRSVLVVHDLMPNARRDGNMAGRYIRWTQTLHCRLRRPVCAVSAHTLTCLRRLSRFAACPLYLWSNSFYAFERAVVRLAQQPAPSAAPPGRQRQCILLCSGIGANKDFGGALALFQGAEELGDVDLRVVGFGDDAYLAQRRIRRLPAPVRQRIVILPRLSLDELAAEYRDCDVVWVHSLKEGFGRPIVEARISGRPVVASAIGAFRRLQSLGQVRLYKPLGFAARMQRALAETEPETGASAEEFHRKLESEVAKALGCHAQAYPERRLPKRHRVSQPARRPEAHDAPVQRHVAHHEHHDEQRERLEVVEEQ